MNTTALNLPGRRAFAQAVCACVLAVCVIGQALAQASANVSPSSPSSRLKAESTVVPRVQFVDYKADEVITLSTAMGIVTRIILSSDEKITRMPDTGFPSHCDEPEHEWCIRAKLGDHQITVKPKPGATRNNLEISTDKRDYSFLFLTSRGAEHANDVSYRVIVRYPMPELPGTHVQLMPAPSEVITGAAVKPAPTLSTPTVRNTSYSMRYDDLGQEIVPSLVFDDGRFTYMKFERAREIPAVFAVDGSGQEIRVSFHSERLLADPHHPSDAVEADYLVVRRVAKAWRLRLGTAVAEISNNAFDATGIETHNGTTVPTLKRETKE